MVIHILQMILMAIGGTIAVVAVGILASVMLALAANDLIVVVKYKYQSHRDTRMFNQVEEFRRDFS